MIINYTPEQLNKVTLQMLSLKYGLTANSTLTDVALKKFEIMCKQGRYEEIALELPIDNFASRMYIGGV